MNKHLLGFIAIAAIATAIGIYAGIARHEPGSPADAAVSTLMQTTLPDTQQQPRKISEWQGKHLLVNFWATWCPPCVAEMPELVALQAELGPQNFQIIGIGIDSPANIREFAEKHQITYPLLIGGMAATELARQFGNTSGGLPFTVLIGADGQVRQTYLGRLDMGKLRSDLKPLHLK